MIRALFVVALLTLQSMALDMDDIKIMRESGVKIAFPNEYKAHTISASTRPADLMRVNYLRLNGQYLRKIPAWLPQMSKLVKLELEDTHIDLIDLFALKPLTNLNTLDLSNNPKLFDKGGSLSKLLTHFSLSELYLNNTGGGSSDYADIGNSTSLIKLDLSDNSISSINALHLERLKHLKKLTLKNSGLSGTLDTAYLPKSLVKLNLSSNNISRLKYSDDFPLLESLDISMDRSYLKFDEDWDDAYILKQLRSGKFNKDIVLPKSIMKRLGIKYSWIEQLKIKKITLKLLDYCSKDNINSLSNKNLACKLLKYNIEKYNFLQKDKSFIKNLIRKDIVAIPDNFLTNRNFIIELLKINGAIYSSIQKYYKNDIGLQKIAIQYNPFYFLHYIDSNFERIIKTLNKKELLQVELSLKSKKLAISIARIVPWELELESSLLLQSGGPILYKNKFERDRDIAKEAAMNGHILSNFKSDKEIVYLALINGAYARDADEKLLKDNSFKEKIIKQNPNVCYNVYGESGLQDKLLASYVILRTGYYDSCINKSLFKNKAFMKSTIDKISIYPYKNIFSNIFPLKDKSLLLYAIEKKAYWGENVINKYFSNDINFIITLINKNPYVYFFLNKKLQTMPQINEKAHKLLGNFKKYENFIGTAYFIDNKNNCSQKNKEFIIKMLEQYYYIMNDPSDLDLNKIYFPSKECMTKDTFFKNKINHLIPKIPTSMEEWIEEESDIKPFGHENEIFKVLPIEMQIDVIKAKSTRSHRLGGNGYER